MKKIYPCNDHHGWITWGAEPVNKNNSKLVNLSLENNWTKWEKKFI